MNVAKQMIEVICYAAILCLLVDVQNCFNLQYSTFQNVKFRNSLRMAGPNDPASDRDDFVTKLFGWAMPKPESLGLNRFDRNTLPENYPCVKDEWAPLLSSDSSKSLKLIRQTLYATNLCDRKLTLAYSGQRDGWSAKVFHSKVDRKGPAVVLCKTVSGAVFGGYNPTGWVNYGELRGSIAAFLFLFPEGEVNRRPIKLQKM